MSKMVNFNLEKRFKKINEMDRLLKLNALIDWEDFRDTLNQIRRKERKSNAGRSPYDVILMFKILVLQQLHNLSDDQIEFQIRDRLSFSRFLGFSLEDTTPDSKTIWLFREALIKHNLMQSLFLDFEHQLEIKGYQAKKGQIVDASFVEVPKQRNTGRENEAIKAGNTPSHFLEKPSVGAQKDTDARWAKKGNETYLGYKTHTVIDNQYKLIRNYAVTSAEIHDAQMFTDLLTENTSLDVWADSAYFSKENELLLQLEGYRSQVHKKGYRNNPLTDRDKKANTTKSRIRTRVEHVFGSITNEQHGLFNRVIGLARNQLKVGMMSLTYNMRRFVTLEKQNVLA